MHPFPTAARKAAARKAAAPAAPVPAVSQEPLPAPWQQHMNQQYHRFFYYNPVTKKSTWERPRIPSSLSISLPPKANGHLTSPSVGKKMRDRPPPLPPKAAPRVASHSPHRQSLSKRPPMPLPKASRGPQVGATYPPSDPWCLQFNYNFNLQPKNTP